MRCVPDKGVAYVRFSRDGPFAASRAIDFVGANDDGEIEGGDASEWTLKIIAICQMATTRRVGFVFGKRVAFVR